MSMMRLVGLAALLALGAEHLHGAQTGDNKLAERAARMFSPEMRRIEARLMEVTGKLADLPELQKTPFATRYGFRSNTLLDQEAPHWVQVDLGGNYPIDRIVAIPAHIPSLGDRGKGYGFPLRFRIEVANDPGMEGAVTVVDRTAKNVENPGRYPMDFRLEPTEGRYLRFTSTRHFPIEDGFIFALEELIVLSGNNTVGVGQSMTASSSLELYPNWSLMRINNGQSALGMPVTTEESPSRGYQSAITKDSLEEKWLQVDLGREYAVDEIRLLPVESGNFETLGLQSFPRAWTVGLAKDPGFTEPTWSYSRDRTNLVGHPGGCAELLSGVAHRGRYLRFSTQDLWGSEDLTGFALAEIQAYSDGENVALGKPVTAKDAVDKPPSAGWAPSFVTDGFTSRYRLTEYPDYLDLIAERGRLVKEQALLLTKRNRKLHATGMLLGYGGGSLGAMAALGWGWLLLRQRTMRRRTVAQLRDQISRDLHDDIGSNLGGIVLLSEMGSRHGKDAEARADFAAIKQAAEETAESMQDIVWLIQRDQDGLRDLVARMRHSAEVILGEGAVSLAVEPPDFRNRRLSLLFRRHVFLAFKETLNNVRKHAGTTAVVVRLTIDGHTLSFEVQDKGSGFDTEAPSEQGHGLNNLQRRAERLKGSCEVASEPREGTRVYFKVPLTN